MQTNSWVVATFDYDCHHVYFMYDYKSDCTISCRGEWGKQFVFVSSSSINDLCLQMRRSTESQTDNYTMSLLGVQASRCQCVSGAQHSSSASLMGGIKLLVDLYWLTWLMVSLFTGLICMVLRWVFSGSSVNHVFSEKETKSYRDKEEGQLMLHGHPLQCQCLFFKCTQNIGRTLYILKEILIWINFIERNSDMIKICSKMSFFEWRISVSFPENDL